jgi:hypothetical protein
MCGSSIQPLCECPAEDIGLSPEELRRLVVQQREEVAELEHVVTGRREEIRRLKGPPNNNPGGKENATTRKPARQGKKVISPPTIEFRK